MGQPHAAASACEWQGTGRLFSSQMNGSNACVPDLHARHVPASLSAGSSIWTVQSVTLLCSRQQCQPSMSVVCHLQSSEACAELGSQNAALEQQVATLQQQVRALER